jgi:hypothetical protein
MKPLLLSRIVSELALATRQNLDLPFFSKAFVGVIRGWNSIPATFGIIKKLCF